MFALQIVNQACQFLQQDFLGADNVPRLIVAIGALGQAVVEDFDFLQVGGQGEVNGIVVGLDEITLRFHGQEGAAIKATG